MGKNNKNGFIRCEHTWDVYPVPGNLPPTVITDPLLPLISIVTPSYNQGQFIRETVESVLSQEYPNIEYWVIDGNSTDETPDILREYENDPRFNWLCEPDRGQSDAINKGLARCRGQLFSWLNSDDVLRQGALRHVASAWLALERPAIIYGLAGLIDETGADLGYFPSHSPNMTLEKILFLADTLPQPATFAPTDHVREIGGVDPSLHLAMDLDLWIRLAGRIPLYHIPHILALFREHPASKSVALATRFIDEVARVLDCAADRRLLPVHRARSRVHLFAARTYLMPGHADTALAWSHIKSATANDYTVLPEVVSTLFKALIRRFEGKGRWSAVRLIHAKLRQIGLRI